MPYVGWRRIIHAPALRCINPLSDFCHRWDYSCTLANSNSRTSPSHSISYRAYITTSSPSMLRRSALTRCAGLILCCDWDSFQMCIKCLYRIGWPQQSHSIVAVRTAKAASFDDWRDLTIRPLWTQYVYLILKCWADHFRSVLNQAADFDSSMLDEKDYATHLNQPPTEE